MRCIVISVASTVLRQLNVPKRLQDMQLSPEAGLAQMQGVDTNSDSAAHRVIVITGMQVTQADQQLVEGSPLPPPPPARKAKRQQPVTKAARRRHRR